MGVLIATINIPAIIKNVLVITADILFSQTFINIILINLILLYILLHFFYFQTKIFLIIFQIQIILKLIINNN